MDCSLYCKLQTCSIGSVYIKEVKFLFVSLSFTFPSLPSTSRCRPHFSLMSSQHCLSYILALSIHLFSASDFSRPSALTSLPLCIQHSPLRAVLSASHVSYVPINGPSSPTGAGLIANMLTQLQQTSPPVIFSVWFFGCRLQALC